MKRREEEWLLLKEKRKVKRPRAHAVISKPVAEATGSPREDYPGKVGLTPEGNPDGHTPTGWPCPRAKAKSSSWAGTNPNDLHRSCKAY